MLKLPLIATAAILAALLAYLAGGALGAQRKLASLEPVPATRAN